MCEKNYHNYILNEEYILVCVWERSDKGGIEEIIVNIETYNK